MSDVHYELKRRLGEHLLFCAGQGVVVFDEVIVWCANDIFSSYDGITDDDLLWLDNVGPEGCAWHPERFHGSRK